MRWNWGWARLLCACALVAFGCDTATKVEGGVGDSGARRDGAARDGAPGDATAQDAALPPGVVRSADGAGFCCLPAEPTCECASEGGFALEPGACERIPNPCDTAPPL